MRNCVLTHESTVTRSRSMRRRASSASNRSITTVVLPRMLGVTCAVHRPKPKGAGTAPKNTSSLVISPAAAASWWKKNQRFWLCSTHFGMPVVPDVELMMKRSSAPYARRPWSKGASDAALPLTVMSPAASRGDHDVLRDGKAVGTERVDELGGRAAAVLGEGDDPLGAGLAQDVADLGVTGTMARGRRR